ncbi:MAG: hypothetical protein NTX19_06305 [Gemmatimonadetes bacterium]|nr:hypothetical protein [Gemmatimonadota bacterium]
MTSDTDTAPVHSDFGVVVVVGGGCYGSQYVRQLRRARAAGKATWRTVVVVDRDPDCAHARASAADPAGASDLSAAPDAWAGIRFECSEWTPFFARWLDDAVAAPQAHVTDTIVPSPLMPHLLFEWMVTRARNRWPGREVVTEVPGELAGVPWQKGGGDGTRYASYATWICPINCIEPLKCPHTGGPRDWSFHESLPRGSDSTALLRVTHRHYGVGMMDVADVVAADALIHRELPAGRTVRVATASHCHGAVAGIRMAAAVSPASPTSQI